MCPKRENVTNLAAHTHRPETSTPIVQIYRECSTNCSIRFMVAAEIELSFASVFQHFIFAVRHYRTFAVKFVEENDEREREVVITGRHLYSFAREIFLQDELH